jgi:hypothetical protein
MPDNRHREWVDGLSALHTRARNLAHNAHCVLTTGRDDLEGIDLVVEGAASQVRAVAELINVADAFESKYGSRLTAPDGTWFGLGDSIRNAGIELYRVSPTTAFGSGRAPPTARLGGRSAKPATRAGVMRRQQHRSECLRDR